MSERKDTNYDMVELLDILGRIEDKLENLPTEYPKPPTDLNVKGSVTVENPTKFDVSGLEKKIGEVLTATEKNKPVNSVNAKIVNQKEFPKEIKIKGSKRLYDVLKSIEEKVEQQPIVNVKENKIEWPRKPIDAIPVVLTDANRKSFYNALTSLVSAVRSAFSELAQRNLESMQFENGKLKTTATISGDVIVDNVGIENIEGEKINPATEDTLAKTVGFDKNSNITTSIVTVGTVKTITETDGVKTLTTIIDKTDVNNISITEVWS